MLLGAIGWANNSDGICVCLSDKRPGEGGTRTLVELIIVSVKFVSRRVK